ncbi:MAG: hypothetical protein HBSAPP03_10540 [Phycisphaerae bacterium]|nr:MAG: hypothetical protein HBSAPP03_10540 [Phycisphaerae bacterium]
MTLLALLAATPLVLTACNTIKGIGRDITYAGERSEEALSGKKGGTEPAR